MNKSPNTIKIQTGGKPLSKTSKPGAHKRSIQGTAQSSSRGRHGRNKELKVEEEQKAPERKRVFLDRSQINLQTLNGESREMKLLVEAEVKSPRIKRRQTLQNVTQMFQPKKIEQEDWEERIKSVRTIEEQKQKKLEWRAQFKELVEVPPKREKSEQKKVQGDLIRIVHTEESESQIQPRLKESFWEKIGFKDKKKQDKNLDEGKEKIDTVYRRLKDTVKNNNDLKNKLEKSRQTIKDQSLQKERLMKELEFQKQQLIKNEEAIQIAQAEHQLQITLNHDKLSQKQKDYDEAVQDFIETKEILRQNYELAMMRLEDKMSQYFRIIDIYDSEIEKNRELHELKEDSMILSEEEQQINSQLALSKPLVTEIMEYFNRKETENAKEEKLVTLVGALQMAIEECLMAEQKFQKAAYYDANKFLPFERAQRSAYTEKLKFNQQ